MLRVNCDKYALDGFTTCEGAFNLNTNIVIGVKYVCTPVITRAISGSPLGVGEFFRLKVYLAGINGHSIRVIFDFKSKDEALKTFEEICNKIGEQHGTK